MFFSPIWVRSIQRKLSKLTIIYIPNLFILHMINCLGAPSGKEVKPSNRL